MRYLAINLGSSSIKCNIVDDSKFKITDSFFEYHHGKIEQTLKKLLNKIPKIDIFANKLYKHISVKSIHMGICVWDHFEIVCFSTKISKESRATP